MGLPVAFDLQPHGYVSQLRNKTAISQVGWAAVFLMAILYAVGIIPPKRFLYFQCLNSYYQCSGVIWVPSRVGGRISQKESKGCSTPLVVTPRRGFVPYSHKEHQINMS